MTAPAVIIPWRDDRSQSLRYTLRGLKNLPHGEVVIAGDRLTGLTGLTNLETPRHERYAKNNPESMFSDSQQSRLAAAAHLGKGYAYLMDDDMFIMEPVEWVAPVCRRPAVITRRRGSYWEEAGFHTANWLRSQGVARPFNFEVHVPLLVDVEALLEVGDRIAESDLTSVWLRSAYGNLKIGHVYGTITDPKATGRGVNPHPSWPIWSTGDTSFHNGIVGKKIRRQLPEPSPWEV